ncbi:unnamed protein product, partial [Polarella glacialis]
ERLEDLGGVDSIIAEIRQLIVQPLAHPEVFSHLGVQPPTGVLLHGPPGSGKTKLAHAIAGSTGVPFFRVAATEIVSGMSGESEAKIRQLFQAAIAAAPSLLFMDEVDSITPKRDSAGREMERRIVAQLLTCMDELKNTHVVVLGATNRPDALDPALRRAGRFDREIAMGIPDEAARAKILEKMVGGMRLSEDLDIKFLANKTPGFVGADLSALTQEAALNAVSRAFTGLDATREQESTDQGEAGEAGDARAVPYTAEELAPLAVEMADFTLALTKVQPSSRREGFTTIPDVTWEDIGSLQEVRADMEAAEFGAMLGREACQNDGVCLDELDASRRDALGPDDVAHGRHTSSFRMHNLIVYRAPAGVLQESRREDVVMLSKVVLLPYSIKRLSMAPSASLGLLLVFTEYATVCVVLQSPTIPFTENFARSLFSSPQASYMICRGTLPRHDS